MSEYGKRMAYKIGYELAAAGTVEAIEAAKAAFVAGEKHVFDTAADNFMLKDGAKIESYTPDICVLDFSEVSFVDSSGIAVVINAMRAMARIEGKLYLDGLGSQPMKVFRASGIDKLVEIKEAVL